MSKVSPEKQPGCLEQLGCCALILAGGLGTRLRSAVADRPKALAEVAGRPFLAWQLEMLSAAGVQHAILCTGYRGEMIRETFGPTFAGMQLDYSREHQPLGTGGALRAALSLTDAETLLVLNGDSFCHIDLAALARQHQTNGAAASLVLTHVENTSRYGRVETDAAGRVTRFTEKGDSNQPGWINAGVYLLQREVIESIAPVGQVSLERQVFPNWIGRGLYGQRCGGEFIDIGTPESYAQADEFFSACPIRW